MKKIPESITHSVSAAPLHARNPRRVQAGHAVPRTSSIARILIVHENPLDRLFRRPHLAQPDDRSPLARLRLRAPRRDPRCRAHQ
ncbi:hypothetical protein CMV30_06900 [Nibricoccus aquaticus]|uniref:Uncharacterized protein n=1 Tax=Nibricoccus aquaticus TaxID=2576891 RepID=A0A290QIJ3_9BACT|nr:hypothetical protein CMV30_06900 [Nibricoccus aquaticus]